MLDAEGNKNHCSQSSGTRGILCIQHSAFFIRHCAERVVSLLLLSGIRAVESGAARAVWFGWRRRRRERYDLDRHAAAVLRYETRQAGDFVHVTVTLSAPGAWVHWFVDGAWHGRTRRAAQAFYAPPGRPLDIRASACRYRDVDWRELRGALPLGLRTIEWTASSDAGTADYAVQASDGGSTWSTVTIVRHDGRWRYQVSVGPLDDDTVYDIQVVPRLRTGEEGTAVAALSERIVRAPNPVDYDATFDSGSGQVTVA